MPIGNCNIAGIGLSEEDAELRPESSITISKQTLSSLTTGRFYLAVQTIDPGDVAFGLVVDNVRVKILNNESVIGNKLTENTKAYKALVVDFPMRFTEDKPYPQTHTIVVLIGKMDGTNFLVQKESPKFTLVLESENTIVSEKVDESAPKKRPTAFKPVDPPVEPPVEPKTPAEPPVTATAGEVPQAPAADPPVEPPVEPKTPAEPPVTATAGEVPQAPAADPPVEPPVEPKTPAEPPVTATAGEVPQAPAADPETKTEGV